MGCGAASPSFPLLSPAHTLTPHHTFFGLVLLSSSTPPCGTLLPWVGAALYLPRLAGGAFLLSTRELHHITFKATRLARPQKEGAGKAASLGWCCRYSPPFGWGCFPLPFLSSIGVHLDLFSDHPALSSEPINSVRPSVSSFVGVRVRPLLPPHPRPSPQTSNGLSLGMRAICINISGNPTTGGEWQHHPKKRRGTQHHPQTGAGKAGPAKGRGGTQPLLRGAAFPAAFWRGAALPCLWVVLVSLLLLFLHRGAASSPRPGVAFLFFCAQQARHSASQRCMNTRTPEHVSHSGPHHRRVFVSLVRSDGGCCFPVSWSCLCSGVSLMTVSGFSPRTSRSGFRRTSCRILS